MKPVSIDNKLIAQRLSTVFEGPFTVTEFLHDIEPIAVDILQCGNRPIEGITSIATIGLSDTPMIHEGRDYPVRVELVGVAPSSSSKPFGAALGTAAFTVMRSGRLIHPGAFMENVFKHYFPSSSLRHLYFTTPFVWKTPLETIVLSGKTVSWLQAIPIFTKELNLLRRIGSDGFEKRLEESGVNVYDFGRHAIASR